MTDTRTWKKKKKKVNSSKITHILDTNWMTVSRPVDRRPHWLSLEQSHGLDVILHGHKQQGKKTIRLFALSPLAFAMYRYSTILLFAPMLECHCKVTLAPHNTPGTRNKSKRMCPQNNKSV